MKNHKTKRGPELRPQGYEHRVAVAIEALSCALAGAQLLAAFLTEQLGPEWKTQRPKIKDATREFRRACRWLKGIDRHV